MGVAVAEAFPSPAPAAELVAVVPVPTDSPVPKTFDLSHVTASTRAPITTSAPTVRISVRAFLLIARNPTFHFVLVLPFSSHFHPMNTRKTAEYTIFVKLFRVPDLFSS